MDHNPFNAFKVPLALRVSKDVQDPKARKVVRVLQGRQAVQVLKDIRESLVVQDQRVNAVQKGLEVKAALQVVQDQRVRRVNLAAKGLQE